MLKIWTLSDRIVDCIEVPRCGKFEISMWLQNRSCVVANGKCTIDSQQKPGDSSLSHRSPFQNYLEKIALVIYLLHIFSDFSLINIELDKLSVIAWCVKLDVRCEFLDIFVLLLEFNSIIFGNFSTFSLKYYLKELDETFYFPKRTVCFDCEIRKYVILSWPKSRFFLMILANLETNLEKSSFSITL